MRKGLSPIVGFVVMVALLITVLGIVLSASFPAFERMQDNAAVDKAIERMNALDQMIREVAQGGKHASRRFTLMNNRGGYFFDDGDNSIYYELATGSDLVSPGRGTMIGSVSLTADTGVSLERTRVNGTRCYMMRNNHVEACVRAIDETFAPSRHDGLVGYWRMDEADDQDLEDWALWEQDGWRGTDGTDEPSDPGWTDGRHGKGLSFDGVDDRVTVPDADALDVQEEFTVTAWFRPDREINASNDEAGLVSKEDAYGLWWQQADAGELRFGTFGGNIVSNRSEWLAGRWYHVAAVHDGDTSRIYVDGELDREASNSDTVTVEDSALMIGHDVFEDVFFDGRIDGVRLYNRSLSREEVRYQWLQGEDITYLNTSELLVEYRNRDLGRTETPGLSVRVNGLQNTSFGNGWTEPSQLGTGLGAARVHAYVASEHGHVYDVYFDLMSGADFLEMEVR